MSDRERTSTGWDRWYGIATSFIAPATFISALLFYFGYVSSRAQFSYFGVDVDTLGLDTREYVMRSPPALLVPALLLLLIGAATAALLAGVRSGRVGQRSIGRLGLGGAVLGGAGLVMVFLYAWIGAWIWYPLVTPLVISLGAGLVAIVGRQRGLPLGVVVFVTLVAVVSTFWATATLAQWTGRGLAENTAENLDDLPAVVLDTTEPLYLRDGVTRQESLPPQGTVPEGQTFRYRYYGLRLLVQSGDRMFLVPERWTPSNSTLVFDMSQVRIKYRFVNQPP
ncbi:hypothetical protein [Nocardioides insulae]|uniref:hypothetical protein n=1 Tax=Nocardioides insulae TaxID=394734 RepID=UPI00048D44FC|nr:hypothetical protein [Nocardioides insulae]